MKKVLIGLGVLAAVLLIVALALPAILNSPEMEGRLEAAASDALGREVTVEGAPDLSLFPPSLSVRGLTVANAEGFDAPYLLRVAEADVGVRLLPLLGGTVEITRFDLASPDINLQATPEGEANWVLTQDQPEEEAGALPDIRLGTVRITDGTITYDGGTGQAYEVAEADVTLRSPSLDEALTAEGEMLVEGRPSAFTASVTTPRSLAEAGTARLMLDARIGANEARADVTLGEALAFGGTVSAEVSDLRDLMALGGAEAPTGPGFERLSLAGEIAGTPERLSFAEGTRVAFDETEGTGSLTLDLSAERPSVAGALTVGMLDLRPYLPAAQEGPEPAADAPFPPWSEEEIDLSALSSVNADLRFAADAILLPQLAVGESAAALSLQDGRLVMTLDRMALYGGAGSGTLTVDAARQTPSIAARFALEGVDAAPLSADAAGITRLRGTGDVELNLRTAGDSQADFVRNLSGTLRTELADGAIEGVNLGKVARAALGVTTQLREGGLNVASLAQSFSTVTEEARAPGAETDFSSLLVDAAIEGGVVTSDEIALEGPYYAVDGEAAVNLPAQEVRMTLTPAVSAADGETQRRLIVPILVSGTFSDPKIGVDAAPLAREAAGSAARDALGRVGIEVGEGEGIEDAVRNRAARELGGLLGGSRGAPTEDQEAAPSPRDRLIEQGLGAVFGRQRGGEEPPAEEDEAADGG
jgi:AsmA protein